MFAAFLGEFHDEGGELFFFGELDVALKAAESSVIQEDGDADAVAGDILDVGVSHQDFKFSKAKEFFF